MRGDRRPRLSPALFLCPDSLPPSHPRVSLRCTALYSNLNHRDCPKLVIADMRHGAMKRYIYEGDMKNSGKMGNFLGDFFNGKLKVRGGGGVSASGSRWVAWRAE